MLTPESVLSVLSYALVSHHQLRKESPPNTILFSRQLSSPWCSWQLVQLQVSSLASLVSENSRAGRVLWNGRVPQLHFEMGLQSSQRVTHKVTQDHTAKSGLGQKQPPALLISRRVPLTLTPFTCLVFIYTHTHICKMSCHTVSHMLLAIALCCTCFTSIQQMGRLRPMEVKGLAQGRIAGKGTTVGRSGRAAGSMLGSSHPLCCSGL